MYPELAAFEPTTDQAKAVSLQRQDDKGVSSGTDGEYVATILSLVLDGYVARHVHAPAIAALDPAYLKASKPVRDQVDALLNIPAKP